MAVKMSAGDLDTPFEIHGITSENWPISRAEARELETSDVNVGQYRGTYANGQYQK
jgi:hypothetical protein